MSCYGIQDVRIKLPSQRTLREYTHYIKIKVGFSSDVDQAILDAAT